MKKAVKIQKYKARIAGTGEEVIGYIAEGHKHLHSTSSHDHEKSYVIFVTEISMPNCSKYGTFIVDPETIEPVIGDVPLQEAYSNSEQESEAKLTTPSTVLVDGTEQFYCVSSDALVYGDPCEKWCGDENCKTLAQKYAQKYDRSKK